MATVTGYTAARIKAIEDANVVGGSMVGGHLILETFDETEIDAGPIEAATTRDTLANLTAANAVHPVGRIIVPTDSVPASFKLSDGVTAFNLLPWYRSQPDPLRNEYGAALVTAGNPTTGVLTNLTNLGSLTFVVGAIPMRVRMRLMDWFGSVATDHWRFFITLSDATVKGVSTGSPNQVSKYQGPIEVEWFVSTPGTYVVKGMYARILGTGTLTIPLADHYLEVAPWPGI